METGTTLRENGLRVVTEFMPISARFIANKASYQFKHREMDEMLEKMCIRDRIYHIFPDQREGSSSALVLKKPKTKKSLSLIHI